MNERVLTAEQTKINKDPAYWDHFDQWWTQDFSWHGLKDHKILDHPDQHSLQDYWREEADQLIEFAGTEWTRFHLPPHDCEGNVSPKRSLPKKDWRDVIQQKLQAASEFYPIGKDTRAQLQGVCFPSYFSFPTTSKKNKPNAQQSETTIHLNATWARFDDRVSFKHARFGNYATFYHASFGYRVEFEHASFSNDTNFGHARFGALTTFSHTCFGNETYFNHANFNDWTTFYDARFAGDVNFQDARFAATLRFGRTKFKGRAKFHNAKFHPDTSFAEAEFAIPNRLLGAIDDFWLTNWHKTEDRNAEDPETEDRNAENQKAETYQSAFRVLRQHMEKLGNHEQEMKFAKLGKQANERRVGSTDVSLSERNLSRLYGLFADYGQSIWRPFFGLPVLFLIAAFLYYLLGGQAGNWGDAVGVAFQSSLPPISFVISDFYAGTVGNEFLNALDEHPLVTRLIMIIHGTFSIALLFFLLLALRRKFQLR